MKKTKGLPTRKQFLAAMKSLHEGSWGHLASHREGKPYCALGHLYGPLGPVNRGVPNRTYKVFDQNFTTDVWTFNDKQSYDGGREAVLTLLAFGAAGMFEGVYNASGR